MNTEKVYLKDKSKEEEVKKKQGEKGTRLRRPLQARRPLHFRYRKINDR